MSKLDLVNKLELSLSDAKAIVDVCRAAAEGTSAHRVGLGDESLSWSLWVALRFIDEAKSTFRDYQATGDAQPRGPRAV